MATTSRATTNYDAYLMFYVVDVRSSGTAGNTTQDDDT